MSESGGRRIKRAINIDIQSIRFCSRELLEKLSEIDLIHEYISRKRQEIDEYNKRRNIRGAAPSYNFV